MIRRAWIRRRIVRSASYDRFSQRTALALRTYTYICVRADYVGRRPNAVAKLQSRGKFSSRNSGRSPAGQLRLPVHGNVGGPP